MRYNKDNFPDIDDIVRLCKSVKKDIDDECRAYEDSEEPGILLTVGSDGRGGWGYQTGDTQFMGDAYHYPHWGQSAIHRDTDCQEAAREILDEIEDAAAEDEDDEE